MTSSPRRQRPAASALLFAEQRVLTLRFSPTPRGARLARRLASQQMDAWGWAYGSPVHDTVELVVAELAANAVTHGRAPGRDAERRLTAEPGGGIVRVEVSDAGGNDGRSCHRASGSTMTVGVGWLWSRRWPGNGASPNGRGVRARQYGPLFTVPAHNSSIHTS
ncbi:ATP-binding protein [Streptomyces sp. NPDC055186]